MNVHIPNFRCSESGAGVWPRLAMMVGTLLVPMAQPIWSQSAVWQPQGATTGSIYYNGGNVGIGTSAPYNKLTVAGGSVPASWALSGGSNLAISSQSGGQSDENLLIGVHTGDYSWIQAIKAGCCHRNLALNPTGGNVGIGTTNPQYRLAVEGSIGARDIIVTNATWSDYVFRPDYRLQPLTEVASFIRQHGHLPEIPSEQEVKDKGVSVGEMQAKLLAKIEELTLHMIQAEERNNRLEAQNREIGERLVSLEKGVAGVTPVAAR